MNHESHFRGSQPAIIVHGGAHPVPEGQEDAHREGCLHAVNAGWTVLQRGGSAVEAVEAAVRVLEDDPTFNAGTGSELNSEGEAEMDAAIMDGSNLNVGGVGALQGVRHPISVARQLLECQATLLVAAGARRFAEEVDAELCDAQELITEKQRQKWQQKNGAKGHDTVGAVAIDAYGHLAAATSTGGTNQNLPGRIGDSPLVGCGFYADDEVGACALTGDGEAISRVVLAKTIIDAMRDGEDAGAAISQGIEILTRRVGGEGGGIGIDRNGHIGWNHSAANLPCAYMRPGLDEAQVFLAKSEEQREAELFQN
jgi:beta-aspartyl-peptidase (threonine type)